MIDRIGFVCEQCGKSKLLEYKELEKQPMPEGWERDEFINAGYALDFCSSKCHEVFKRRHPCLSIVDPPARKKKIEIVGADSVRELLQSMAGHAMEAREMAIKQLSEEFGVPEEYVAEFSFHLTTIICPKCRAKAGELCHIQPGDETVACPDENTSDLKAVAHRERIDEARRSWNKNFN